MSTGWAREDMLRVWTPLQEGVDFSPPYAGINIHRISFVLSRSSAAPHSYQLCLPHCVAPPFRVFWLGRWDDPSVPYLCCSVVGVPVSASRVPRHLAALRPVTSVVFHRVPQVLITCFFSSGLGCSSQLGPRFSTYLVAVSLSSFLV